MMIEAAIFDYGGVLMRTVDPTPRRMLEQQYGLGPGEVDRLLFENLLWDEAQLGHTTRTAAWADVGRRLGLGADALETFRQQFWAGDRLDEDLVDVIRQIQSDGYRTALLSNAPADFRGHLDAIGIADAFDVIVISGCEGVMKPSPAIYHLTLEQLRVAPRHAIFLDDNTLNVRSARDLGIHAILFAEPDASLAKMTQLLEHPVSETISDTTSRTEGT